LDRIDGGDGDDVLRGGSDVDVLIGRGGEDRFIGQSELEAVDLDLFESTRRGGREDNFESEFAENTSIDRLRVVSPDALTPTLQVAIASELRHPVTFDSLGRPVLHRPWLARELAQIESIDLSGLGLTNTDGLELLPNLRFVDLSDNALAQIPTNLPQA
jgi:Leucine-rich repeat (LRR) protein